METTPQTVRETLAKLRELPPIPVERRLAALGAFWQKVPLAPPPETGAFPWAQVRRGIAALAASAPHCSEPVELGKPGVLALILAGNTPLLAWPTLHYCVLLGIPVFIKQSRDETVWTRHFVETLTEIDAEVAALLHLDLFPGMVDERMLSLLTIADATIAYGSDETLEALWPHLYWKPFLPFGHATSIGFWCDGSSQYREGGEGFARDVLMYDQQGCLSPQTIFVDWGNHGAISAGQLLAGELAKVVDDLKVPPVTDLAIAREVREVADIARFTPTDYVIQDSHLRWTVIYGTQPKILSHGTGHGIVRIVPTYHRFMRHLPFILGSLQGKVSSVGVAGDMSQELGMALEAVGVSRICRAGEMQTPPLDWKNGGVDLRAWLVESLAS
ncbi:acyl-CoA reductase [Armatimonas rosea]|uniref:Long-chain-fatty-acyl-CoA reductase n=1 Tax=Armatimonas rosea TaxID=685828 RepID=A0A7W9W600_ARMRO|nr:acyl-CoA reductase [Armatimonas rosea]MBB6049606.1 hypothetical protein [Armatimonas rosea]